MYRGPIYRGPYLGTYILGSIYRGPIYGALYMADFPGVCRPRITGRTATRYTTARRLTPHNTTPQTARGAQYYAIYLFTLLIRGAIFAVTGNML